MTSELFREHKVFRLLRKSVLSFVYLRRPTAYHPLLMAFSDFNLQSLHDQLICWGEKPTHAKTLLRAFMESNGRLDLTDRQLPKTLRSNLSSIAQQQSKVLSRHVSADGTAKLLIGFDRGGAVESVLMPSHRPAFAAGCVSSQIGCAMGCDFCASTRLGLERNLESGEIVEQFLHLRRIASESGRRLRTLVFMGMGEPMHNLDNVLSAIRVIAEPELGGIGWRHITISTVGIVQGIDRLIEANLNVHLAVSLHAPDDETRARIVPTANRYQVAEILQATRRFERVTGRIPTIEYCLLADVNDSDAQAQHLADLLRDFRVHVNLIPYNWIGQGLSGRTYQQPPKERMARFLEILRHNGAVAHFRRTRGDDVNAACGQLREMQVATVPAPGGIG